MESPFLRGYCAPTPKSSKISLFCALSQNYQHLFDKWCMHLIVNCPRNSKIASKLRQAKWFLSYWSKTNIFTVWSIISKSLGLLKFQCHFWVPWTISYKMHNLFFFLFFWSCWLFWNRAQNMLFFDRRCSTTLIMSNIIFVATYILIRYNR